MYSWMWNIFLANDKISAMKTKVLGMLIGTVFNLHQFEWHQVIIVTNKQIVDTDLAWYS